MAYIGREPLNGFFTRQVIANDGSTTTFALTHGIASTTAIIVSVNAVILQPDVGYSLSGGGTSIIFASAPNATTYIHYLGQSVQQSLVDMNGVEFILDADADTTLTADTDDEIDIKVGGTDRSTIKATGFHNLDSIKFVAGTGDDMQIYHDGSNSYITNAVGALKIATETSGIAITIGHSTSEITIADNMTVAGDLTVTGTTSFADTNITNVGSIALDTITNDGTDITLDSSNDIVIDAAGGNIEFKDAGTLQLTLDMDTTAGVQIVKLGVDSDDLVFQQYDGNEVIRINDDRKLYFYDDGGENISSDGTDFTFASGNDINLTATTDINVPANVGMTFGDDGEKIEGNGTNLTISSSGNFEVDAASHIKLDADSGNIYILDGGTSTADLISTSGNFKIRTRVSDGDFKIEGNDGGSTITALTLDMSAAGKATFNDDVAINDNLFLASDNSQILIGTHGDVKVIHDHNVGLKLLHTATGDDSPIKLTLQTSEADIAADDVLGAINFQAPTEGTGTDAILVAAGIEAVSEGDFAADNNATKLSFKTAASEAAAEKMSLSSAGVLDITNGGLTSTSGDIDIPANIGITFGDDGEKIEGDGTNLTISSSGTTTIDSVGNIVLDGSNVAYFKAAGTTYLAIINSSTHAQLRNYNSDKDISFLGNDGGVTTTMLTLDTSEAGAATFNDKVIATELDISGAMDIDGTSNLDAVDIDGAVQIDATFTSGVDGQGYDTKFFGDTASAYIMWDTSADKLLTAGGALIDIVKDKLMIGGTAVTTTAAELNILDTVTATATELNYSDLTTLGTTAASKVITADANNLTKISGGIYLVEDTLSFDATQDWDVRASPVAKVTLTANVTFDLPSNPTTGQYIAILCIQDGTGSRTIAWNAAFEFAADTTPTATTTASLGDLFTFRYNGAKWLEVGRNLALTLA